MTSKMLEIRDSATFIPALAVRLDPSSEQDRWLLDRSGYGRNADQQGEYVLLVKLAGGEPVHAHVEPIAWGIDTRTMYVAHSYLLNQHKWSGILSPRDLHQGFDSIRSGQVIDVEWILGISERPKSSESATSR